MMKLVLCIISKNIAKLNSVYALLLGVQISFRRLQKTVPLINYKTDVKRHIVRLDIRQHHNLEILAILYQHHIFYCTKMSSFEPNKRHLRELLIYFFKLKKSAAEAHRLFVEAYGDAAISERSCRE